MTVVYLKTGFKHNIKRLMVYCTNKSDHQISFEKEKNMYVKAKLIQQNTNF